MIEIEILQNTIYNTIIITSGNITKEKEVTIESVNKTYFEL